MLCALCVSMFSSGGLTGLHHTCLKDLQRAAQGGCKICISLVRKRDRLGPDPDNEQTALPFLKYKWAPEPVDEEFKDSRPRSWSIKFDSKIRWLPSGTGFCDAIYIHVSCMNEAVPDWWASLSAHAASDLDSQPWRVRREIFPLRPIADHTGHESVLEVGKTWLEYCHQLHNCDRSNGLVGSTWYPKRLIRLPDSTSPRLVETSVEPPDSRYATLSHCWGSGPNFTTLTTNNLDDFRKGIPINALPQSFRDAIVICNRLCIRHIWIDSLCIMQDSESDWLLHTEEMSSIYQNCYLNLSFDAAANPREGAFRYRNSDILQECCAFSTMSYSNHSGTKDPYLDIEPLRIALTDGPCDTSSQSSPTDNITGNDSSVDTTSMNKRPTKEFFKCLVFAPELDFTWSTNDLPLSSRGWVVQERLLSPRVLHFTEDRIMWECEESASLHEALPYGILGTGEPFDMTLQPFNIDCFPGCKPDLHRRERSHNWEMIVRKYSGCLLTYPEKDKLVAFAAIAQRFSSVFGEDYYAGHFRQNMPFDLAWGVSKQHSDKKSATRRHPTWSWTSVDSQIMYFTAFDRSLVEVEDVSVSLVDPSHKYGPVKGGQLVMRCLIVRGVLGTFQGQGMHDVWTVHLREIVGHGDHFAEMELIIDLDGPEKEVLEDVYFIPVLEFSGNGSKIEDITGLVLLKQADGFYRRVGSWHAWTDFPGLKSGPMFEVVDKYSDCHQVLVIV